MKNTIQIPRVVEGKEFYADRINKALSSCEKEGYEAQFMPAIIDARISAEKEARIWQTWWSAPSVSVTGRTSQGNPIVVYAHVPNYFSNPRNIETAIKQELGNGAGIMPQNQFQKLVDLNELKDKQGNRLVWIVDYDALKNSKSDVISFQEALEHPQTIPFVGGEERAEKYLEKHKKVYGEKIGVWHSNDLSNEPRGRVLFVGLGYDVGLVGDLSLFNFGRFVGVKKTGEASSRKIIPAQKQLADIIIQYVASCNQDEVRKRVSELYK